MRLREWPIHVIQLLSLPGLLVSFYLYLYHQEVISIRCSAGTIFDCSQVSGPASPYSSVGELPIAALGLIGYAAVFLVIWLRPFSARLTRYTGALLLLITGLGVAFTLYLKGLELLVIHALCEYCLYSALIMLAMFILALLSFTRERRSAGRPASDSTA